MLRRHCLAGRAGPDGRSPLRGARKSNLITLALISGSRSCRSRLNLSSALFSFPTDRIQDGDANMPESGDGRGRRGVALQRVVPAGTDRRPVQHSSLSPEVSIDRSVCGASDVEGPRSSKQPSLLTSLLEQVPSSVCGSGSVGWAF